MKRLLLSLICCSPLLFSPTVSFSIELVGPTVELVGPNVDQATPSADNSLSFDRYGPVTSAETLWAISSKLRPDASVSVQQTMVAIYKSNPYAFFQGNINKIIPQSILKVPPLAFVSQQTDQEAMDLIRKYSSKKKTAAKVTKPKVAKPEVTQPDVVDSAELEAKAKKLLEAEQNLADMKQEMLLLNEQYIVATEAAQALKLKLQPLSDQISMLNDRVEEEALIQQKLQKIIDDYRAQIDAIEPPPFSGDGMLNELLRLITASLTNLLIVILSPLLLLLLIFVVVSRIRTKRLLAEQEQELAESTAILMEESGQFDELLTGGLSDDVEEELDFSADETLAEPESVDIDDLDELTVLEEPEAIDLTADEELETSEDDPFGISGLTDDEELISAVDLDDSELETSEDDPFGIGALTDDDESELVTSEDDPFGIAALTDDIDLTAAVDLDDSELDESEDDPFGIADLEEDALDLESPLSASEQADLDLAAEWEAQVSADSGKDNDAVDESESELDLAAASTEITDPDDIDSLLAETDSADLDLSQSDIEDALASVDNEVDIDLSASDSEAPLASVDEEIESLALDPADLDLSALDNQESSDVVDETIDSPETEAADLDLSALDSEEPLATVDEAIDSLETEAADLDLSALDSEEPLATVDEVIDSLETETADLDLSAQDSEELLATADEAIDLLETETADLDLSGLDSEDSLASVDEAIDSLETETAGLDSSSLDNEAPLATVDEEIEIADLDLSGLDIEEALSMVDNESNQVPTELEQAPVSEISDQLMDSEPSEDLEELDKNKEQDALAQQMSDVAFNEDVPLPKVDANKESDFIDIETLLGNSDGANNDEPYSELDLDLGLDEFPDVVDLQESVDIDDDENGIGAQLDLARAYLEIDDQAGAKEILMSVVNDSNGKQRAEIDKLLSRLK